MSSQPSKSAQQCSDRQRHLSESTDVTPIQTRSSVKSTTKSDKGPKLNDLLMVEKRIISQMDKMEEKFFARVHEFFKNYESHVNSLTERVKALEVENNKLAEEIRNVQRVQRAGDIVVRGIPVTSDEDPKLIFENICSKVGHSLSPYTNIFRIKIKSRTQHTQNRHNQSPPIVVKFSCVNERGTFMHKFRKFGPLGLDSLGCGFVTGGRVSCFESVSPDVNLLLREAIRLKRQGKVISVFTRDGLVYVKADKTQPFFKLEGAHQLNNLDTDHQLCGDNTEEQSKM